MKLGLEGETLGMGEKESHWRRLEQVKKALRIDDSVTGNLIASLHFLEYLVLFKFVGNVLILLRSFIFFLFKFTAYFFQQSSFKLVVETPIMR